MLNIGLLEEIMPGQFIKNPADWLLLRLYLLNGKNGFCNSGNKGIHI